MRAYAEENLSLERLWARRDTSGIFTDIKTLYRYHRDLVSRIDGVLTLLCTGIVTASGSVILPDMNPGEDTARHKLRMLFVLLDTLIDILHQKNITGIILEGERHSFLHNYLYRNGKIILLNTS